MHSNRISQVLSLSVNRIKTLPTYIAGFQKLRVLKVDRNPLEYPPMSVMSPQGDLTDRVFMKSWIESVKRWLVADSGLECLDASENDLKLPPT